MQQENKDLKIESLTATTLPGAIQLAQSIFLHDAPEIITLTLTASLNPENYKKLLGDRFGSTGDLGYWIALENDQVVGLAGYYTLLEDCHEAAWLGWFCVDSEHRGKRIGVKLLEKAISHVKGMNKSFLRLYTSDIDEERNAHRLYLKRGFKPFRPSHYDPRTKTYLLYFQLNL